MSNIKLFFKKADFREGLFFLILSLVFINLSVALPSFGGWALSPGLFPFFISSVILILSLILIINSYRTEEALSDKEKSKISWKNVLITFGITIIYCEALDWLGFPFATIVYLMLFLYIAGERKWYIILIISVSTTLMSNLIFGILLKVMLP